MPTLKSLEARIKRLEGKKKPKGSKGSKKRKGSAGATSRLKKITAEAKRIRKKSPSMKWPTALKQAGKKYRK